MTEKSKANPEATEFVGELVGEITEDEKKLLTSLQSAASDIVYQLGVVRLRADHLIQGIQAAGLIERLASDEAPKAQFRSTAKHTISQIGQAEVDKARLITSLLEVEMRVETFVKELHDRFNIPSEKTFDVRGLEVYVK